MEKVYNFLDDFQHYLKVISPLLPSCLYSSSYFFVACTKIPSSMTWPPFQECMKSEAEKILPFSKEDLIAVVACTNLTQQEILTLWRRFNQIREKEPGYIRPAIHYELKIREKAGLITARGGPQEKAPLFNEKGERIERPPTDMEDDEEEDGEPTIPYSDLTCLGFPWSENRVYKLGEVAKFHIDNEWKPYRSLIVDNVGHPHDDEIEVLPDENKHHGLAAMTDAMGDLAAELRSFNRPAGPEYQRCWQYDPFQEYVTKAQMRAMPSLKNNPLCDRILDVFSEREDGRISFEEFVDIYSTFHYRSSRVEKIKSVFKVLSGGDGFIQPDDMKQVLYLMLYKGYDWDARQAAFDKIVKERIQERIRCVYSFIEMIVEDRDTPTADKGKPGGNKKEKPKAPTVDQLDVRTKARVVTWVENICGRYNDAVRQAKEESEECLMEELTEEDIRKNTIKLNSVICAHILGMENLPLESFFEWHWVESENPLRKDPLTTKFADAGFGKNLFTEVAIGLVKEKKAKAIDAFLNCYIDSENTEDDVRITKMHEMNKVLNTFLNADKANITEADEASSVVWKNKLLEQVLKQQQYDSKAKLPEDPDDQAYVIVKEAKKRDAYKELIQEAIEAEKPEEDVKKLELADWKILVWDHVQGEIELEQKAKDAVPDTDKNNALWKEVVHSFFDNADVRMIVSKMMMEGDPSINEEDQLTIGWDKAGKISCQEFNRLVSNMADFDRRFCMDEV